MATNIFNKPLNKLAKVVGQAFAAINSDKKLQEEQRECIIECMDNITKDDIHFDRMCLASTTCRDDYQSDYNASRDGYPVTYLKLWDDEVFTMGIFILKHGVKIPLHDHPKMYGFIKIIEGKAKIVSYTQTTADTVVPGSMTIYKTTKSEPISLEPKDKPCVLYPDNENIHEVYAENGPMAFLDVLAPPYSDDRECHYYIDLSSGQFGVHHLYDKGTESGDYYTEEIVYTGPPIHHS